LNSAVVPQSVIREGLTPWRIAQVLACLLLSAVALVGGAGAAGAQEISPSLAYAYDISVHVYDGAAHTVAGHVEAAASVASESASAGVHETAVLPTPALSTSSRLSVAADAGGGNFVYRALNSADRASVDAGLGIVAKNPEGTWSLGDHVARGSSPASWSQDPWIATSRDPGVAAAFDSGNGVVRINLDLVNSPTAEAWKTYPRLNGEAGLPYHYSFWQQEVSIFQSIPAGAIG